MRRSLVAIPAAAALLLAVTIPASAAGPTSGTFQTYSPGATAITYAPDKVPVGAKATVVPISEGEKTVVLLIVKDLLPHRQYGAHVHVKPCGALPADAGPHFQNVKDPVVPSVDPAYANPDNEIWLDFHTDARGHGQAVAKVGWEFGDRPADSVVIHAEHTHTEPGNAGTAGPRLACLTLDD
ncbi:superoxide dismutase, Cu-Zn family [Actinokineospora alba]|uniref:Superoxide dismutase, Cu-Zn family n=1 Tax=Actinokineospora alba TaxID=504798 RepID=A0A1H0N735_9PSEU|nr:superoxide dismutase [Actinokineospora alba]TDP68592.1 Cu-Zn family superoxide dismutase [Actinokineospora alba]SDH82446.1 superoxide dismutase, Cu-Zn family [Actinokineospora alba]SDO88295.1 superoxide dismutase, Cu-Zn family [Actinokineospora alba]